LIKRDFKDVAAPMIALYALALSLGATIPAGLTIPIEDLTGVGWRPAVAVWGVVALVALVLWLPRARRDEPVVTAAPHPSPARALRRDHVAWAVTLFMGLQSLCYYAMLSWLPTILESHGMSDSKAGWMLSYTMFPGMAASLLTPTLQRRIGREDICVGLAVAFCGLGYLGLLAAADSATYVWVTALGIGQGIAITLALSFIIARARDHHIAHLSTMAQSIGYLIASTGPFILGALHGLTSSWTVPLLVLLGTLVPLGAAGLIAGRGGHVLADAGR
jgi:CP family cyanate transporter-like MFS transporter